MKVVTLEVRMRLDEHHQDEAKAILEAKYRVMNTKGVLSVVQFGPIDSLYRAQEVPAA